MPKFTMSKMKIYCACFVLVIALNRLFIPVNTFQMKCTSVPVSRLVFSLE